MRQEPSVEGKPASDGSGVWIRSHNVVVPLEAEWDGGRLVEVRERKSASGESLRYKPGARVYDAGQLDVGNLREVFRKGTAVMRDYRRRWLKERRQLTLFEEVAP